MRSNGLTASAYIPVADLDPRVADALLTGLKQKGVAAYTKPVESTSMSGFDGPEFRVDVKDRLYVDSVESERVKAMISEHDPGLVTSNDDLTWAQIVAGFDQPVRGESHPWPANEDVDRSPTGDTLEDGGERPDDDVLPTPVWRRPVDQDDEGPDRFVPPVPPPLPRLEPWQQLAWVGVCAGPLLLLAAVLFSVSLPTWVSMAAVAGFIGGFVTLVANMRDHDDSEDDPDNGAVV
jgi:hypothetical protein